MLCSGRFAGDRTDIPGVPASGPSRPGWPRWRWRRCSAPAAAAILLGRNEAERHLPGQGDRSELPHRSSASARPRCCSSASATPAKTHVPGADRHASRSPASEGEDSSLPFGDPRPAARTRPARPAGLGARRRPTPACAAPPTRAAPTSNREDLRLRPAEAGRDDRSGLEAERRAGRQVHAALRRRRRARRRGARRRPTAASRPGGSFATEITDRAAGNRSHRQRRSRRNQERQVGPRSAAGGGAGAAAIALALPRLRLGQRLDRRLGRHRAAAGAKAGGRRR